MEDPTSAYGKLFIEDTELYNRIVLGAFLPQGAWASLPRFFQTWLRNYIGGVLLYFISGILWCFYVYYWKRNVYLPKDAIPSRKAILLQIAVAMKAMPCYSVLPTLSEYLAEIGWTKSFPRIYNVGWLPYITYLAIYLVIVEFGVYWMHRELHDIKPLYKYLHATHHIYNKQNTLSPFAGLAFHPLDGILQAIPHSIALFIVPTHFTAHLALLFIEGIWTANIHDCIDGKVWPVMGAGYHTIHHTTYRHNYGHYTIWMDWMFGTLRDPEEDEDVMHKDALYFSLVPSLDDTRKGTRDRGWGFMWSFLLSDSNCWCAYIAYVVGLIFLNYVGSEIIVQFSPDVRLDGHLVVMLLHFIHSLCPIAFVVGYSII